MRYRLKAPALAAIAVAAAGVAIGALSVGIARGDPGGSFAGRSVVGAILELAAGWSLLLVGVLFALRRRRNAVGPLLTAAGFAWFLPEWSNPSIGSPVVFTAGLVGFLACPPLVAHAALAYPRGRLGSLVERAAVALGYGAGIIVLGLLPAAVFDPQAEGCLACPSNLVLVRGDAGALAAFTRWGLRLGLASSIVLALLALARLARGPRAALTVSAPVLVTATAYLGFVAWDLEHSLARNVLSNDSFDVVLWRREAVALTLLAAGVLWGLLRARQARAAVAALVVELGRAPRAGGVRDALARALREPTLELAYRRPGEDEYVNPGGLPVDVTPEAGRAVTPVVREGEPVAVLIHDARLLGDPGTVEEVVSAARLAIENERFQAELRAQLERLRASRARIVETGDAERRLLERDLHDGAQQRLVGLALALQMLRAQADRSGDGTLARLDQVDAELREALAELREVAHGIYPAVLADEGFAAALETLAEGAEATIELDELPEERFDAAVENVAYFLVAEALKRTHATSARVGAARTGERLVVDLEAEGRLDEDLVDLEDRVGALDGSLFVEAEPGRVRLRAELPCA